MLPNGKMIFYNNNLYIDNNNMLQNIINNTKIIYGGYTGTGSSTNSLSFDFEPLFLLIITPQFGLTFRLHGSSTVVGGDSSFLWTKGTERLYMIYSSYSQEATFTDEGKTIKWKGSSTYSALNVLNNTYKYIAIGIT